MVFLPTLPISMCGFEKGSKGGKREAGRPGGEGPHQTRSNALVEELKHCSPHP